MSKAPSMDKKIQELMNHYGDWYLNKEELDMGKMTKNLYPYDKMFSPIKINGVTVKNRLVMAPMGNISMCDETGRPNEKMLAYFTERAKGGVGLITTGLVPVTHGIDNSITELGQLSYFPRIDRSRTVFAGWRDLAASCHSFGSRLFIQITAGLGRVGNPQCLITQFKLPVSASWNKNWYIPQIPCMPLTDGKIKKIVKNIGQAAADAKAMNIDGIYLHGHEGYLMDQLTSPAFNRRKLGRYSDWQQFGIDMIKEIRARTDARFPIMYRIDLSLALNETYGDRMDINMKKFKSGRTIEMTLDYMKNLVKAGVDMFDVDLGCYDNWFLPHPPGSMPPGCFLDIAKIAKEYFEKNNILSNAGLPVPVVAVGKLGYPDLAEKALRDEKCDMIMLGRPLLADPEWPNKARTGKVDEIRPCIGCQEACLNEFVEGGHPQCAVNPRTAFEEIYPKIPQQTDKPCRIAVIGAGPAGITCATTAAQRGHTVDLYEADSRIGGRLNSGSVPGIKYEIKNYLDFLRKEIEIAEKNYNFKLLLNTKATPESIKAEGYDKIVVATGTSDVEFKLPGYDKANTVQAVKLLENPSLADGKDNIVVIGGGVVGCETAFYLKKELNKKNVTVVEMTKYFMNHTCTANRGYLLKYMYDYNIKLLNCTKLLAFEEKGVKVLKNNSKTVPDPYLTWTPILPENIHNPLAPKLKEDCKEEILEADLVVLAAGGRPNESVFHDFQEKLNEKEVYNIGDSFKGGKVFEATKSGYELALSL